MHFRHIGLFELNDHYIKGVEYIDLNNKKFLNRSKILFFKGIVYLKDFLTIIKVLNNSLNINILFKESPSEYLKKNMKIHKWIYKKLPLNPYL